MKRVIVVGSGGQDGCEMIGVRQGRLGPDLARREEPFFAANSLVVDEPRNAVHTEDTFLAPRRPCGVTEATGSQSCRHSREAYGFLADVGYLYNHESTLRLERLVSQKIILDALLNPRSGYGVAL